MVLLRKQMALACLVHLHNVCTITLKNMAGSATTSQYVLYDIFAFGTFLSGKWGVSGTACVHPFKRNVSIYQTPNHAYVQTDKIHPRKYVVAPDHHPQIGDRYVFQTTNNGSRQGRIEVGTQNYAVGQNKAHHARQQKLR